jgi:hypothetical protein
LATPTSGRRETLPDRLLPLLYFGFAHVSLLLAFLFLASRPTDFTGFYYHAHMVAVVHLVTLGWITASIFGALYLVAPMALTAPLPRRRLDVWAFAAYAIGVTGMVGHFWIGEPNGMLWSAPLVVLGAVRVLGRSFFALRRSRLPGEVRLHFDFSMLNFVLAAGLGITIGFAKLHDFLPAGLLPAVLAHAHLAAIGWATMMVMAAGYRLLPMLFPSAMPTGGRVRATAWVMEIGVLGLTWSLLIRSRWALLGGAICLLALTMFVRNVAWMVRHPRKPPRSLTQPDWSVWQIRYALLCLAVALVLGAWLLFGHAPADQELEIARSYGVVGLIGFLTQIVIGVQGRILPLAAWMWRFEEMGFDLRPHDPHALPSRPLQVAILALWVLGLPALALGIGLDRPIWIGSGAVLLAMATSCGAVQAVRVVRRPQDTGRRGRGGVSISSSPER